jgi:hypothetical protein
MQRKYAREGRVAVLALVPVVLATPAAGAGGTPGKVVFLDRGALHVVDLSTGSRRVVASHVSGAVGLSGDGRLVSVGGRIVGGPSLPTARLVWAPSGERAAYQTRAGAVFAWSPTAGRRLVVGVSWGTTSFAWGRDGSLALGRAVCHVPCGVPLHQEVWIRRGGTLRRVAGPLRGVQLPRVAAVAGDGRALWWSDPQGSASIAADGLPLYANRARVADTLVYPDYVRVCGSHLAVAQGGDRYAMHGKRILFDGRNVSRDPSHSWVAPSCSPDGATLVGAASRNTTPPRIGNEHRSIWQLLPARERLTSPPVGFTDESPRLLGDGSILFLRTKSYATRLQLYGVGTVELLRGGKLTAPGTAGRADNYYGHYDWPDVVSVS